MTIERSDHLYDQWLEGSQKFDYFVAGVTLALIGYLSSASSATITLGWNVGTLHLVSLAVLLLAAVCSVKHLEAVVTTLGAMHYRVHLEESFRQLTEAAVAGGPHVNVSTGDVLTGPDLSKRTEELSQRAAATTEHQDKWIARTTLWYRCRNWLLIAGLSLLVLGRWLAAAQATLRQP
jgi:hypothetical protein